MPCILVSAGKQQTSFSPVRFQLSGFVKKPQELIRLTVKISDIKQGQKPQLSPWEIKDELRTGRNPGEMKIQTLVTERNNLSKPTPIDS